MEYNLEIKGTTIACDVTVRQDRTMNAGIGDTPFENIQYDRISDHQICLIVDGHRIMAWVDPGPDGKTIILGGEHFFIQDKDLMAQTSTRKKGLDKDPLVITPPMPAVVVDVVVQQGDPVEKGDPVVVVSAMKMETTLTAPHGGTVTRIGVKQGDKVMPGDILVDIEKEEDHNPDKEES